MTQYKLYSDVKLEIKKENRKGVLKDRAHQMNETGKTSFLWADMKQKN